jgi:hypothetical protein
MCIERLFFGDFSSGATEVRECGGSLTSRSEVMGTPKLLARRGETRLGRGQRKPKQKQKQKQILNPPKTTPPNHSKNQTPAR